ncbi:hypothetical protein CCHR01_14567 [Colletotrichum chrysophilum]|uniref:Uncharacterized protein n=1 Tax=Colletotrichum chrysophilum TaxID=1836956 RepID=A0AAD9ECM8_9PEZI|nr:hypothetical protein CCHR01_14567 [Colletotrichum chrysophilum]
MTRLRDLSKKQNGRRMAEGETTSNDDGSLPCVAARAKAAPQPARMNAEKPSRSRIQRACLPQVLPFSPLPFASQLAARGKDGTVKGTDFRSGQPKAKVRGEGGRTSARQRLFIRYAKERAKCREGGHRAHYLNSS